MVLLASKLTEPKLLFYLSILILIKNLLLRLKFKGSQSILCFNDKHSSIIDTTEELTQETYSQIFNSWDEKQYIGLPTDIQKFYSTIQINLAENMADCFGCYLLWQDKAHTDSNYQDIKHLEYIINMTIESRRILTDKSNYHTHSTSKALKLFIEHIKRDNPKNTRDFILCIQRASKEGLIKNLQHIFVKEKNTELVQKIIKHKKKLEVCINSDYQKIKNNTLKYKSKNIYK